MGHFPRRVLAVVYQSSQTDGRRDSLSRLSQSHRQTGQADWPFSLSRFSRHVLAVVCLSRLSVTDGTDCPVCLWQTGQSVPSGQSAYNLPVPGRWAIFTVPSVPSCFRETQVERRRHENRGVKGAEGRCETLSKHWLSLRVTYLLQFPEFDNVYCRYTYVYGHDWDISSVSFVSISYVFSIQCLSHYCSEVSCWKTSNSVGNK